MKILVMFCGLIFSCNVSALQNGASIPDCQLNNTSDQVTQLAKLHEGHVLYVDFWASWCPPCAKSFPFMNRIASRYADQGFRIIAVNMDENRSDAEGFLERMPAHFDIVYDIDGQCAKTFNVQAMPSSYLIDKDGVIQHIHLGFRSGEAELIEQQIQKLMNQTAIDKGNSNVDSVIDHKGH